MSVILFELQEELLPSLRARQLAACERKVAERMAILHPSPFHVALDLRITNHPNEVAAHFDKFFEQEAKRFKIRAAYAEMNGFDINPNHWFFDVFAFEAYGGHEDYDWLSDWQSLDFPRMTITGLESLQQIYASDAMQTKKFKEASDIAGLLVVIKFQDLIRRAATCMQHLNFPLLATAHDYDFVYE